MDYSGLRVFGCITYAHIVGEDKWKLKIAYLSRISKWGNGLQVLESKGKEGGDP